MPPRGTRAKPGGRCPPYAKHPSTTDYFFAAVKRSFTAPQFTTFHHAVM